MINRYKNDSRDGLSFKDQRFWTSGKRLRRWSRALSSFSATLADQRFQSRSIGSTRLGQPISVISKGRRFAKLKHDYSRDRLPSIKLPFSPVYGVGRYERRNIHIFRINSRAERGKKAPRRTMRSKYETNTRVFSSNEATL